MKKFSTQVRKYVSTYEDRLTAVVRQSVQDVTKVAQKPTAKGGKMRVKTGFLRRSGQLSLTGMPSGPVRGDPEGTYEYDTNTIVTVLSQFKLGMTIYFGWTAEYAKYREAYDGFLASAVQDWKKIVAKNVSKVKAQIK